MRIMCQCGWPSGSILIRYLKTAFSYPSVTRLFKIVDFPAPCGPMIPTTKKSEFSVRNWLKFSLNWCNSSINLQLLSCFWTPMLAKLAGKIGALVVGPELGFSSLGRRLSGPFFGSPDRTLNWGFEWSKFCACDGVLDSAVTYVYLL